MKPLSVLTESIFPNSCQGCGLCCIGIGSPVLVYQTRKQNAHHPDPIPPDLPQELLDEIDFHFSGLERGQEPQEFCLWYDQQSNNCRHYEWRPEVCRAYELGGSACLQLRKESGY